MLPSGHIPVAEAASRLKISPRRLRALIEQGELGAEKVGRQWLVSAADVVRYQGLRPGAGRPLSPRRAWALLFLLSGERPAWVGPRDRSELRHHLQPRSPAHLVASVRRRAKLHPLRVHPGDLRRLRVSERLILSGASAASEYRLDLHAPGVVEAYVSAQNLRELAGDFAFAPSEAANVLLRSVDASWPFDEGLRLAPAAAVAVDLLEAQDERSRAAGHELLERLLKP